VAAGLLVDLIISQNYPSRTFLLAMRMFQTVTYCCPTDSRGETIFNLRAAPQTPGARFLGGRSDAMSPLGYGREYRRQRRSVRVHKLLMAVAIALAIAVLVGMVLEGDPGPGLGVDEWSTPPAQ
jgi:hypothetical protein